MKAENRIGTVTVERKTNRPYLGIRLATPFDGMFALITKELKTLRRWVKENDLTEQGPYLVRYYHCDMKSTMDVEVGFVTDSPGPEGGEIKRGLLPEGRYATLIYRGNGLRGNQAMMKWAQDQGIRFEPLVLGLAESYTCRYEAYLTDYRVESRKLLWDVELSLKIAED